MAGVEALKPPWWRKPAYKVFIRMSRLGLSAKPVLRAFPTEVPTGVGFMKRAGLVTDGRPGEFEALAGRCAVFRLDPL